ncbi:Rrf2 family transcriptional regulator [Gordoniibacillus kamchatkensis]|uniref:Rrf2 family transcriptional regulator n=1 Tax=Gordoniibacillus kamchatkensis TaxID=1590651 RepID=A0ABR5AJ24_9BACL|nr:Rrf2 family transcriptional regulator [Paenibacillus sp. VKM B-2647]KIL41019.1 Rrf2 family transcriptional regulator [Paenibacillus sp. VKM B-2647]
MNSEFTIAVHSLVLLAYKSDHMATSDYIAMNVATHPARIRKVMSLLRKQGYVRTKEGIGGGFTLSCDPAKVTLAEIYRLTSLGTLKPSWCSGDPGKECPVSANMKPVMDSIFFEAELNMERYLEGQTIAGVLEQLQAAERLKPQAQNQ